MKKWTVDNIPSQRGKLAVITGANSGIGWNTALELARAPQPKKPRPPGRYFGPSRMFQLKGDPVPVPLPKPALDEAAARQLWETAERLTGAAWPVGEPVGARNSSRKGA